MVTARGRRGGCPVAHGGPKDGLPWALAVLVLVAMMPATIVIPVVRRFVAAGWQGEEWVMHAFMAVNLLGGCVLGPLLASRAERLARRRWMTAGLAAADGLALLVAAVFPPVWLLLAARLVQGGASVGAVSLLMGAARGRRSGAAMGLLGCAVVLSIVLGIALGAILGKLGPRVPLAVGGALGLAVAAGTLLFFPRAADAAPASHALGEVLRRFPGLRAPTLVVALERFAVGGLVVTLSLHAHHVLGVPDGRVSGWYSAFLVTFGVATWPMSRLAERVGRWRLVALGAAVYGATLVVLPLVPAPAVALVLAVGGLGSAMVYGPGLGLTAASVPEGERGSAMAVMNAAGMLGMFGGTTLGGLLGGAVVALGAGRAAASLAVFGAVGLAQAISVAVAIVRARRAHAVEQVAPAPANA